MISIRGTAFVAVTVLVLGAVGALDTSASAASPATGAVIFSRSIYAAFEQESSGVYSIDVGARTDVTHNVTSAQTRGELHFGSDDLYYFAFGVNSGIRLHISLDDTHAALHAVIPIQYCFDANGDQVSDPRCPVGRPVTVDASFRSTEPLHVFRQPGNVAWGRTATATATQNAATLGSAQYAEIVENLTRTVD